MLHGDIADQADDLIEKEKEAGLARVRQELAKQAVWTGECRYCQEPVERPRIFCDTFCSSEFEREAAARKRNGIR